MGRVKKLVLNMFADKNSSMKIFVGKYLGLTSEEEGGGGRVDIWGYFVEYKFNLVWLPCIPNFSLLGCLEPF